MADGSTKTTRASKRQLKNGASASEINRELAIVKRAYSLAVQAGRLLHRPHVPMLTEDNVRKGFLLPAQHAGVKRHLPEHLQRLFTVAYITGWRVRAELLPLEWRHVDFNTGIVSLDPGTTKNKQGREFVMTVELRRELIAQRDHTQRLERKSGKIIRFVFHNEGNPIKPYSYYRDWRTACRAAGLPGRIPHDMRRSAVRNAVRAGIPERVAMQMSGHKTRAVFDRYNIVSDGDLREASKKLDAAATVSIAKKARGQR